MLNIVKVTYHLNHDYHYGCKIVENYNLEVPKQRVLNHDEEIFYFFENGPFFLFEGVLHPMINMSISVFVFWHYKATSLVNRFKVLLDR